jgi:hypothetical protein
VEVREALRNAVETKFNKLGAETNPAVWKKRLVEANDALETYPAEPRPSTVEFSCDVRYAVETKVRRFGAETNPAV